MILIHKVVIENFQSHEKTTLDFIRGLNVIVGPSDQGKSAVLRAIKWALYNEPRGTEYIRQGTTTARVTVELSNGYSIVRERSKSKNKYVVKHPDGSSMVLEGFGNEVPEEVVKAHGIPKVALDSDINATLNIGDQLEGPFLLSESAAVRAKAIGRLTGLHIIDKAIRDDIVDLRRENQSQDRTVRELNEVNEKLEGYKELHLLEDRINRSQELIQRLETLILKREKLSTLKNNLELCEKESSETAGLLKLLRNVVDCEVIVKDCELIFNKLMLLNRLKDRINTINPEIESSGNLLEKTKGWEDWAKELQSMNEKAYRVSILGTLYQTQVEWDKEFKGISEVMDKTSQVYTYENILATLSEKVTKERKLAGFSAKMKEYAAGMGENEACVRGTWQIGDCRDIMLEVSRKEEGMRKLEELNEKYQMNEGHLKEGKNYLQNNKKEIENLLKQYTALLGNVGKCPLCNSEISGEKIKEIIKHYEEVH